MKDLLEYLIKNIVNHPKEIAVEETGENEIRILNLEAHPEDLGKIIGKKGRTIKAIRDLLHLKGLLQKKRVRLELREKPAK